MHMMLALWQSLEKLVLLALTHGEPSNLDLVGWSTDTAKERNMRDRLSIDIDVDVYQKDSMTGVLDMYAR